jgi:hypothetical protein
MKWKRWEAREGVSNFSTALLMALSNSEVLQVSRQLLALYTEVLFSEKNLPRFLYAQGNSL